MAFPVPETKIRDHFVICNLMDFMRHMGQFLQDGKNVRFMSLFFKKWMARAAKPSDIDDFFRFAVTYHDFCMPLK